MEDLVEAIVGILNALTLGPTDVTSGLLLSPRDYNATLYDAAVLIHNTAVKPVTAIVLSIIATLMLATTSTKVDGDRELGVRIIAASMFKIAMVLIACQSAILLLDALAQVATFIAGEANNVETGIGADGGGLGDELREDIEEGGLIVQVVLLLFLSLPFAISQFGVVVAIVLVFLRFMQMYLMSAFASLPIAFFAHEDTKHIGIGYLKRFLVAALTGAVLVITVKFYQALMTSWLTDNTAYDGDLWGFVISNFGKFLVAPIVLIFLMITANGLAKAVVGEG